MPARKQTIQDLAREVVLEELVQPSGKTVLEVGSGTGELPRSLAAAGALVSALDRQQPEGELEPGVQFKLFDLTSGELPFEDSRFDCVVSTEVIEHMRAPFLLLSSMVRVLRPGGILVLTMPNYWNLKYRLRYLLTGNVPRPVLQIESWRDFYLAGYPPHINVLTYTTLRSVLTWEGCERFLVRTANRFRPGEQLAYLPFFCLVKLFSLLSPRQRFREFFLGETNDTDVLFGGRHVLLHCRRSREARSVKSQESIAARAPPRTGRRP